MILFEHLNIFEYFESHNHFIQGKVQNHNDSFSTKTGIVAGRCSINCWKKPIVGRFRKCFVRTPRRRGIDQYRK